MSLKLFATVAVFSIIVSPSFATEFSLPEIVVQQGEELVIPVKINHVEGMMSLSMEINFEPEIISIKSVSKAELLKNFMSAYNVATPGKLLIAMTSGRGVSGEGVLVNINIKVSDSVDDGKVCPLEFGRVSLNGENIGTVQNGRLLVGNIISIKELRKKAILWCRLKQR